MKPMSQDDAVKKNISAMETCAPNAEAVMDVESDISIHAGVCSVVKRSNSCQGARIIPLGRNFFETVSTIV